eukprot:c23194_g1_i2 orf=75-281(-)
MPFYLFRYVDVASLTSPLPQCCMHLSPRHSTRDSTAIFSLFQPLAYLSAPLTESQASKLAHLSPPPLD